MTPDEQFIQWLKIKLFITAGLAGAVLAGLLIFRLCQINSQLDQIIKILNTIQK